MKSLVRLSAFALFLGTIFFFTASMNVDSQQRIQTKTTAIRVVMANNGIDDDGNNNISIYGTNANMYSQSNNNRNTTEHPKEKYEISLNNYPECLQLTESVFSHSR